MSNVRFMLSDILIPETKSNNSYIQSHINSFYQLIFVVSTFPWRKKKYKQ